MANQPTAEQLESRKKLSEFVAAASERIRSTASAWFSRPKEELQGWVERGRAISEIEGSMGYRLIMDTLSREIESARTALEVGTPNDIETRGILKGLRFTQSFILTTRKDADIANSVLAGREGAIGKDSAAFVRNARVEN